MKYSVPTQGSKARAHCGWAPTTGLCLGSTARSGTLSARICCHHALCRVVFPNQSTILLDYLLLRVETQNWKGIMITEGWFEVEEQGEDHRIHPYRGLLFAGVGKYRLGTVKPSEQCRAETEWISARSSPELRQPPVGISSPSSSERQSPAGGVPILGRWLSRRDPIGSMFRRDNLRCST